MVGTLWRRTAIATVLSSVVVTLFAVTPASAYLRDVRFVPTASPMNATPIKDNLLSGHCNNMYIGGLAFVSPGLTKLALTGAQPAGGFHYSASAVDTTGSWRVLGRGICAENTATPPSPVSAARYVKGVVSRGAASGIGSLGLKSATARCPVGKTVIGGGARIDGVTSKVALLGIQRVNGVGSLRATAHEVDPTSASWRVRVRAICANLTSGTPTADYVNGITQQFSSTPLGSTPSRSTFAACAPGYSAIGGGGRVSGVGGLDHARDVALVRSEPFFNGSVWGWLVEAREVDSTPTAWSINATATCALTNGGPPA